MKKILLLLVIASLFFNVKALNITDNTIADIVDNVTPGVVNIDTVVYVKTRTSARMFNDPILERFFGGEFNPYRNNVIPREGSGTGFVISDKGYIITNAHVIQSKDAQVKITFSDDSVIDGKVVGLDNTNDIAVVKFDPEKVKNFKVLKTGNSDSMRIGNWVMAIGSPFGLQKTVTLGIVSAKDRNLPIDNQTVMEGLIQTDASINPGNSGGPLLNMKGEVVGINTAIIPMGQGLGFAISSNKAMPIVDEIIKYGKHIYPTLGVYLSDLNYKILQYYNISGGSVITKIVKDGAAKKHGLLEGDIIIMADKQKINRTSELINFIRSKKIGDKVFFTIMRDNEKKIIKVVLGSPEDNIDILG
ncbi:MAG: trypsin-like peptidase domain-containing protein [Candidatus Muirbacterium halophilum]|nr:trypsin-like peptidase domain-containing protein [Candidatus Muirbacterium halophilum]MCK9477081.1 trypsin-like peptidase domain-containing protein [Candidatus Muirbacterium halophilum]